MTRPAEFAAVRQRGIARSGRLMTVAFLADAGLPEMRFGFAITKKVGNAVTRNRIRRRFREISRHHAAEIAPPGRLVTIARPAAASAAFSVLRSEWRYLVKKLGLLTPPVSGP
ncbi:MAG: ribonuclease P protein component [Verrucomicrobiales bacterium]|nr:ribonuclease P protein component [Verrucomicrobiales bacterium]